MSESILLPIFPLPVALMPLEPLPLHIFEPRYRQMIKDAQMSDNIFGLVYFDAEESETDFPAGGSIGCTAEIRDVLMLEDGRSNIITAGMERFYLEELVASDKPYLVGEITYFRDDEEDESVVQPLADEVLALFGRVTKAAHDFGGGRGALPTLPKVVPEVLSFIVPAAFGLDTASKRELVALRSTVERLARVREILLRTVRKIEENIEIKTISKTNGHSKKPINLD